jgi:hypothetical protein
MSRVVYDNNGHWSTDQVIFTTIGPNNGGLCPRQNTNFGGTVGAAILGPDLTMPGVQGNNLPTAVGQLWNQLLPGGPAVTFTQDGNFNGWIRGHLVNGRWGGSGANWNNLTPLTAQANANHATVEGYIDSFLVRSAAFEASARQQLWLGVYYCVQVSAAPFAAIGHINDGNLYAYAPAFIRVSWRAVSINKPIGFAPAAVAGNMANLGFNPVAAFPLGFNLPARPQAMVNTQTLPANNVAGGALVAGLPANFPVAQNNGFDGFMEIHQN